MQRNIALLIIALISNNVIAQEFSSVEECESRIKSYRTSANDTDSEASDCILAVWGGKFKDCSKMDPLQRSQTYNQLNAKRDGLNNEIKRLYKVCQNISEAKKREADEFKDHLTSLSKSNPSVKAKLEEEKNRDEVLDSTIDAIKGPAGTSGAVQRSLNNILNYLTKLAGINSTSVENDRAKKKLYDERAKSLMNEESGNQDKRDRVEQNKERKTDSANVKKTPAEVIFENKSF